MIFLLPVKKVCYNILMYTDLIGYTGSLLVVISMLMTSVIKLRVINGIGSIIFTGYALMIHSYPTAAMNFCLVLINAYNLLKLLKSKKNYRVLPVKTEDRFTQFFLETHEKDIKNFFSYDGNLKDCDKNYIIFCEDSPAGIFLGSSNGDKSIRAKIDYATPEFRDCSLGKHLYKYLSQNEGTKELIFEKASKEHLHYLLKMGFIEKEGKITKIL